MTIFLEKGKPIIDMYDPKKYPEFYLSKKIYDIGLLNEDGAKILSTLFAEQLNQIIQ